MKQPAAAEALRLFFALWPEEPVRARVDATTAALALSPEARRVARGNYHVTVAFVGEVPAGALERLRHIGRESGAPPFSIDFDAYEYWPKPQVVVVAARTVPSQLQALWEDLHHALAAGGFILRIKKLRPHVTLAHRVALEPRMPLLQSFAWPAGSLCLVRSESGGSQPVYTVLDTWPLLDKARASEKSR